MTDLLLRPARLDDDTDALVATSTSPPST